MKSGLVLDFEGCFSKGIREVGFIKIADFRIQQFSEIVLDEDNSNLIISEVLSENFDFFLSHKISVENNFIKTVMPYRKANYRMNVKWGPWLDSREIYSVLYPNINKNDLKTLTKMFLDKNELEKLSQHVCKDGKNKFHHPLYDALCTFLLVKRLENKVELRKFLQVLQ